MAAPFVWDFEPRNVNFNLTVLATFHPSVGSASVLVPFLDAAGEVTRTETVGPLNGLEPDPVEDGVRCRPGAIRVRTERPLGAYDVKMELVRGIQKAMLPISVQLPGEGGAAAVTAAGAARLHLGGLLLAGGGAAPEAAAEGEEDPGPPRLLPRPRPSEVGATWTQTIGIAGLFRLEIRISTDVPVLSRPMLERLLPCCFTVDTVRGLPNEDWLPEKCEDVFVEIYPQTSSVTAPLSEECARRKSESRPHDSVARFEEPVVWLLGLASPHVVRDWLHHEGLVVEVHDRDPRKKAKATPDAEAEGGVPDEAVEGEAAVPKKEFHSHGLARFLLQPLLSAPALEVLLRADVFPARGDKKRRRAEAMMEGLRTEGLLEEEGRDRVERRAGLDKREDTTDYHFFGTVCTVRASLAVAIPQAAEIRRRDEEALQEQWVAGEQQHQAAEGAPSNIFVASEGPEEATATAHPGAPRALPYRAKLKTASGEEVAGPWRRSLERAEEDEKLLLEAQAPKDEETSAEPDDEAAQAAAQQLLAAPRERGLDLRHERYGRVVIVVDENDTPTIQKVLTTVRTRNAETLGVNAVGSELNIYILKEEQRNDPHLDLLTGFSLLDGKCRLMVVEGLRDGGLQQLLEAVPRNERGNSAGFKMLYNPEVGFSERIYTEFGKAVLRQIKIKLPLEQLATQSKLYSVQGIMSDDTLAAMEAPKMLMELKHKARLHKLREGVSFPRAQHMENLEILYGGYVTDAELDGEPSHSTRALAEIGFVKGAAEKKHEATLAAAEATASAPAALERGLAGLSAEAACLEEAMATSGAAATLSKSARNPAMSGRTALDQENTAYKRTLQMRKSESAPDFAKTNIEAVKMRSEENVRVNDLLGKNRQRETPFLEGEEVFLYSQQRLNCTEKQKVWMRKHMDQEQDKKMWTYGADFLSQSFDFSGAKEPGIHAHEPSAPNDSYAVLPGDDRPPWRGIIHSRPKEEFKKMARDLGPARPEELHEAFVEGEWQNLAVDPSRRKPLAAEVRFEVDKIPHHRRITERPFDATRMQPRAKDFGPKCGFESVHYHGRLPGEALFGQSHKEVPSRCGYTSSKNPVGSEREQKRSFRAPDGEVTMIRSVSLPAVNATRRGSENLHDSRRIPDHTRHPKPHPTVFNPASETKFAEHLTKGTGHRMGRPNDFLTHSSSPPLKEFLEDEQMPRRQVSIRRPEVHFVT